MTKKKIRKSGEYEDKLKETVEWFRKFPEIGGSLKIIAQKVSEDAFNEVVETVQNYKKEDATRISKQFEEISAIAPEKIKAISSFIGSFEKGNDALNCVCNLHNIAKRSSNPLTLERTLSFANKFSKINWRTWDSKDWNAGCKFLNRVSSFSYKQPDKTDQHIELLTKVPDYLMEEVIDSGYHQENSEEFMQTITKPKVLAFLQELNDKVPENRSRHIRGNDATNSVRWIRDLAEANPDYVTSLIDSASKYPIDIRGYLVFEAGQREKNKGLAETIKGLGKPCVVNAYEKFEQESSGKAFIKGAIHISDSKELEDIITTISDDKTMEFINNAKDLYEFIMEDLPARIEKKSDRESFKKLIDGKVKCNNLLHKILLDNGSAFSQYLALLSNSNKLNEKEVNKVPKDLEVGDLEKIATEKGTLKQKNESLALYQAFKQEGFEVSTPSLSSEWQTNVKSLSYEFLEKSFTGVTEDMCPEMEASIKNAHFLGTLAKFRARYQGDCDTEEHNEISYNTNERLENLVKTYARGGSEGILEFKLNKEFASEQLSEEGKRKAKNFENYTGKFGEKITTGYEGFANTINNLRAHSEELGNLTEEDMDVNQEIQKYKTQVKGFNSEVQGAFNRGIDSLIKLQKNVKGHVKKETNRAIGIYNQIKSLKDVDSIKKAETIADELEETKGLPLNEQVNYISRLQKQYGEKELGNIVYSLKGIRKRLIDKHQPQEQIVANLIGVASGLKGYGLDFGNTYTSRVSRKLEDTISIGYFGNSGEGNCQSPTHEGTYNQSLMSFIGDANEEIVVVKDSEKDMVGFVNLHGVKVNGEEAYIVEKVYTNVNDPNSTKQQEESVNNLLRQIKEKENVKFYRKSDSGENKTIEILPSVVPRYLDSLGGQKSPYGERIQTPLVELYK